MNITESELLNELRLALSGSPERPEGYLTAVEIAEAMGNVPRTVTIMLSKLHARGEIECVFIARPAIDGRLRKSPAYRLRRKGTT